MEVLYNIKEVTTLCRPLLPVHWTHNLTNKGNKWGGGVENYEYNKLKLQCFVYVNNNEHYSPLYRITETTLIMSTKNSKKKLQVSSL